MCSLSHLKLINRCDPSLRQSRAFLGWDRLFMQVIATPRLEPSSSAISPGCMEALRFAGMHEMEGILIVALEPVKGRKHKRRANHNALLRYWWRPHADDVPPPARSSLKGMDLSSIGRCWRRSAHSLADKSNAAELPITDIADRSLLREVAKRFEVQCPRRG